MIIEINPFPFYSKRNKYFEILYNGINNKYHQGNNLLEVKNKTLVNIFFLHIFRKFSEKRIIHVHWSTKLYGSKYILKSLFFLFFNFIILFILKIYKVKICWTIHNLRAHDYPHPWVNKIGRKLLFIYSDLIFVQNKIYYSKLLKSFPRKNIKYIPHVSYQNIYGERKISNISKLKRKLGIDNNDIVLLSLGMVRPYKGIDELVDLFIKNQNIISKRIKLMIVGLCERDNYSYLKNKINNNKQIILVNFFVKDQDIPNYLSSADYCIFNYDNSVLTSGSIVLALSYGVPVISKEGIFIEEFLGSGYDITTFKSNNSLLELLKILPNHEKKIAASYYDIKINNIINDIIIEEFARL